MLSRGEERGRGHAWSMTSPPIHGNIAISSLLHNVSLREEAEFFPLSRPFSNEKKKGAHLAAAKDEVTESSVPALPASQAASQTHMHSHTH